MKIKISDYIAQYLVDRNITYNFTVPGGGAMHLNSSFGNNPGIHNVFVQHEQAAAIAAEAFYRTNNVLPFVCCTTGPGGTNTLTGVLGAWLDSIPMLIISGQVKYSTTVRSIGMPVRIFGDQEFDITNVVKPMTKYAEMITKPEMVKYHLDKALFLAQNGRPGPVWLDIPLNIQAYEIDPNQFVEFSEEEMANNMPGKLSDSTMELILEKIKNAKRPVLYSGVEIRTSGSYAAFKQLVEKLNIPVVTSFDGIDLIEEDHSLYAGRCGDVGNRYGNWAVQNSDCLLVLGSRLGIRQVGYSYETWAREAFVIMVHEDPFELVKPNVHVELPVRQSTCAFITKMLEFISEPLEAKDDWLTICHNWKEKYPVVTKSRFGKQTSPANIYWFMKQLSDNLKENQTVVSTNGSACVVGGTALLIKQGQRFIINSGCASMGYDLPAAIGACLAENKQPVVCLAGDGSIQMNLQELQTIIYHDLPIKIFVINNEGYHSIRQTQRNLFAHVKSVGVGPESGDLGFPSMSKIAQAYDIPYLQINCNDEIHMQEVIKQVFEQKSFCICEVFVDTDQVFEPKPSAKKLPDGTLVSPPLEDLAPFLPTEELEANMIIPLVDRL